MHECLICYEEREDHDKVELTCSHSLCQRCYQEIQKRSDSCPFCRTTFKIEDPDPEEWLYLDPSEWVVHSSTDTVFGTERIYVYNKNDISWRDNKHIIPLKRNRQRKKRLRNKNR